MGAASADADAVAVAGCASAAVLGSSADSYPTAGAPAGILADEGAGHAAAGAVVAVADTVGGANVECVVGGLVFAAVSGHKKQIRVVHVSYSDRYISMCLRFGIPYQSQDESPRKIRQ